MKYTHILALIASSSLSHGAVTITNTFLTLDGVTKSGYTNPLAVDTDGANPTTVNDGTPGTARFGYLAKVSFTNADSATYTTTITAGGWSYSNVSNTHTTGGTAQGWGHTSRWYLLELSAASYVTFDMTPWDNPTTSPLNESIDGRPGFVVFAGESLNHTWGNAHTYNNDGTNMSLNSGWDKNITSLGFVTNGSNSSGSSLSETRLLDAGSYTVVFGNIGDSSLATGNKGFNIGITVPEPSTALLSMGGALLYTLRRRRRVLEC